MLTTSNLTAACHRDAFASEARLRKQAESLLQASHDYLKGEEVRRAQEPVDMKVKHRRYQRESSADDKDDDGARTILGSDTRSTDEEQQALTGHTRRAAAANKRRDTVHIPDVVTDNEHVALADHKPHATVSIEVEELVELDQKRADSDSTIAGPSAACETAGPPVGHQRYESMKQTMTPFVRYREPDAATLLYNLVFSAVQGDSNGEEGKTTYVNEMLHRPRDYGETIQSSAPTISSSAPIFSRSRRSKSWERTSSKQRIGGKSGTLMKEPPQLIVNRLLVEWTTVSIDEATWTADQTTEREGAIRQKVKEIAHEDPTPDQVRTSSDTGCSDPVAIPKRLSA